jgi:hypothetical protein
MSARALSMDLQLARIALRRGQIGEARTLAARAFDHARAAGEVPAELAALELFAELETAAKNTAIAALYRQEHELRDQTLIDLETP